MFGRSKIDNSSLKLSEYLAGQVSEPSSFKEHGVVAVSQFPYLITFMIGNK